MATPPEALASSTGERSVRSMVMLRHHSRSMPLAGSISTESTRSPLTSAPSCLSAPGTS
jgi:hypothetical protein